MEILAIKEQLKNQIDHLSDSKFLELYAVLLPFLENDTDENKQPERRFGIGKGIVSFMADDFDALLEDFKDYM